MDEKRQKRFLKLSRQDFFKNIPNFLNFFWIKPVFHFPREINFNLTSVPTQCGWGIWSQECFLSFFCSDTGSAIFCVKSTFYAIWAILDTPKMVTFMPKRIKTVLGPNTAMFGHMCFLAASTWPFSVVKYLKIGEQLRNLFLRVLKMA